MRKTKIVCTLGPSSTSKKVVKDMVLKGMNVARFNMSHGSYQSHHDIIEIVKEVREELNVPVAIMIDTKGPEIRVGVFENYGVTLSEGARFVLTTRQVIGNEFGVSVSFKSFHKIVSVKDKILLNDGLLKLEVERVYEEDVICRVLVGGRLTNNKSINIPGVDLKVDYLSEQDKKDILFGIKEDADIFAISFVGEKQDVLDVRKFLEKNNSKALICSKIESKKGVKNLDEIIEVSDSIMVARGDLGVEVDFEKIPHIQKTIIEKCEKKGKSVITATEMLESMIHNVRPTRAEISDISNAVLDGTSLVMLSGETSIGEFPVLSLETMARIIEETEKLISYEALDFKHSDNVGASVSYAACELARSLNASAIMVATNSGFSASCVSRFKPKSTVIATTPNKKVYNQMSLLWGVVPIRDSHYKNLDELLENTKNLAIKSKMIKKGDLIVQTGSINLNDEGTNLITVSKI